MKKSSKIKTSMLIILLISSVSFAYSNPPKPKGSVQVQYIAVHFGHPDHASVMDQSEFPKFSFYSATGSAYSYTEKQKIVGNPHYLVGYYGEVPEKMGFCANYTEKKYFTPPYMHGVIYVIAPNGVIAYQSPNNYGFSENSIDAYDKIMRSIESEIKTLRKGKMPKALSAKKCKYLKKSAIGQLEKTGGSNIDKKSEGLVGWKVPDIAMVDDNGNKVSLPEVTNGKICVVVFYTLNGVDRKKGDAKGNIIDEWVGKKLISGKDYAGKTEKQFTSGNYADKSQAKKAFAKTMFKKSVVGTTVGNLFNSKEDISDHDLAKAYGNAISGIKLVSNMAKDIK